MKGYHGRWLGGIVDEYSLAVVSGGNMALIQQDPKMAKLAAQDIPSMLTSKLGRVGVPDDIARAILFCAPDMSAFMTDTMLVVDAGEII